MIAPATEENIRKAAVILQKGGVVAFPTETVYGLGADATCSTAVQRIFEMKKRPSVDPLIVHTHSIESIPQIADLEHNQLLALKLEKISDLWPGPLSVVLPKGSKICEEVTSGLPTVAVRIPNHPVALKLLKESGLWLAAPSANPFSYISPTTAEHVAEAFGDKVDMILDGGPCRVGIESTVLALSGDVPTILRPGAVSSQDIQARLGSVQLAPRTQTKSQGVSLQAMPSPGMLELHYSPRTKTLPLRQLEHTERRGKRLGLITFRADNNLDLDQFTHIVELGGLEGLEDAAACLYAAMREQDKQDLDLLFIDSCPEEGVGVAIMDRIRRACHSS